MKRLPAALITTIGVAALLVVTGCSASSSAPVPSSSAEAVSPDQASREFLKTYVEGGRVVRLDQGSDTVSEGQGYGMLLAVAVGDRTTFDAIWGWTQANLERPDGLMAWNWKDGHVVDDQPASDADLDIARALVEGGSRFGDSALTEHGVALGEEILDSLTAETSAGRILLPGLWAATTAPFAYNPSYASPQAFTELGTASGDARWAELAAGSRAVTTTLLGSGGLPPDWATVAVDGTTSATPAPSSAAATAESAEAEYGYDATRLPIRYAESCDPADAALAAKLAPSLGTGSGLVAQLDLSGRALTTDTNPVAFAGRAAARAAADADAARADLQTATALDQTTPTYFGSAWTALAMQMLQTENLGLCPPLASSTGGVGANQDPAPAAMTAPAENLTPVRLQVPSIGVDTGLESLQRDGGGVIQPPVDFASAGWYEQGVAPGQVGPAVIAGHIDSAIGPAVFYKLSSLSAGDTAIVTRADGSVVTFTVDREIEAAKSAFPTDEVYGPTPTPQLRLITCGGVFDDAIGHYVDNVVVFLSERAA